MTQRLTFEASLLILTGLPMFVTAVLVFSGMEWAQTYIATQLTGTSLFTLCSLGVGVTLASLPVASDKNLPIWSLYIPTLAFTLLTVAALLFDRPVLAAAPLIADLLFISSLYRIAGRIVYSRAVLLAQFLPLSAGAGTAMLAILILLLHADLARLSVYRKSSVSDIGWNTLVGAWGVSTIKDFYFRGHYLAFAAAGIATPAYATILRFLDVISRPTDYVFQRLVDRDRIGGRLKRVLWFAPVVVLVSAFLVLPVGALTSPTYVDLTVVGLISGLIFVTKYLAFEMNANLRHWTLSLIYLASLVFSLPMLMAENVPAYPLSFLASALIVSLLLQLRLRTRAISSKVSPGQFSNNDPPRS